MGDYSEAKDATQEIRQICTKVKPEVEKKTGKKFTMFTATLYKELNVTGFIYLIQVKEGGGTAIHLKVYQNLSKDIMLLGLEDGHSEGEEIIPF